jgi:phosphoribosylformylglycinamidine cyclo-ligase
VFDWLISQAGLEQAEALKTFNCGIGMIAVCSQADAAQIEGALASEGVKPVVIGRVTRGSGIRYSGTL